ncbi:Hpt domain-containing protein [Patescibacteria group bacterium]|nr:Hpt domain-containing protein [Patescibacteria group bacterium]
MISEKYKDLYLSTVKEQMKKLADLLLYLEKKPNSQNVIENIFRLIHSMKGAAATMSYKKTVDLLHSMESVIDAVYNDRLEINKKILAMFFSAMDVLQDNFESIEKKGKEINLNKEIKNFRTLVLKKGKKVSKNQLVKKEKHILGSLPSVAEISVSTEKLDKMQNSLEDLLINSMEIKSRVKSLGDGELLKLCVSNDKFLGDLRRQLEKLRIVSLSQAFSSFPYLVGEISRDQNKKVDFIIKDNNLSLDKAILDEIVEILIQLIKNAVSHGISDKQKKGTITIETALINDKLQISVEDNGQGINWPDIVQMAVKNKIISAAEAKRIKPEKMHNLVFVPGISKGKALTTTSGRGVGLSLVKSKVKELEGHIHLDSRPGKGTKFIIMIPQPLSIFRSMTFRVLDYNLAIPLSQVEGLVKSEELRDFSKQKYFSYQKKKYKLLSMENFLGLKGLSKLVKYIVILKDENKNLALPLASNISEDELIMKTRPDVLKNNKYIKGVAISAKGQPVLVMDTSNLE